MTPDEWNKLLAESVPWRQAYLSVAREAKAYLEITQPAEPLSTAEMVEALYPAEEARGSAGICARRRMFRAFAALAEHDMSAWVTKGEPRRNKFGKTVVPLRWRPYVEPPAPVDYRAVLLEVGEMVKRIPTIRALSALGERNGKELKAQIAAKIAAALEE